MDYLPSTWLGWFALGILSGLATLIACLMFAPDEDKNVRPQSEPEIEPDPRNAIDRARRAGL